VYFIRERERETHLLNLFKTRARICAKYNHLHLIFKEKLSYFKVAFVVYFLRFFSVETQCLRLDLHPRFRFGLFFSFRLNFCSRLVLKSFENKIQCAKIRGKKMSGNETPKDETQALRLYKCVCPRLQFLLLNF